MDYSWEKDEARDGLLSMGARMPGGGGAAVDSAIRPPDPKMAGPDPAAGGIGAAVDPSVRPTERPTDSALTGVSGVSGLSGLTGPQANAPQTPGTEPPPQPQTAGRLVKPSFGQSGANPLEALASQAKNLETITDPQQRAVAQDQIARGVASSLTQAGHTVKWQGDQLIVDGRPYVIGGAAPPNNGAGATTKDVSGNIILSTAAPPTNGAGGAKPGDAVVSTAPPADNGAGGKPATGAVDPNQAFNELNAHFRSLGFGRDLMPQELDALKNLLGITDAAQITPDTIARAKQYLDNYTGDLNNPWKNGQPPGGGGGGTPPEEQVGTPEWRSAWEGYNPGEIPFDDLQGFDVSTLMQMLGGGADPNSASTDPATEQMVAGLLANPYTFDQRTVDTLKARNKDELAEMGAMEDDQLLNYGFDAGIQDSNWLASERNAAARDRDRAIVSSNRDIDILKTQTDIEDRRKAAGLGMEFSDRRFDQVLKSTAERRQAVALANDSALRASALKGDRLALREQINAKAAELGLDADKMQLQYTLGLMDDMTKRYGIDVGKDIDLKRLEQQGREFNEELALRFAQLEFQYAELMKRDEWAQLNAGVQLATAGVDASGGGGFTGEESRAGGPNNPWEGA